VRETMKTLQFNYNKIKKLNKVDIKTEHYLKSKGEFSAEAEIGFEKHLKKLNKNKGTRLWYE